MAWEVRHQWSLVVVLGVVWVDLGGDGCELWLRARVEVLGPVGLYWI